MPSPYNFVYHASYVSISECSLYTRITCTQRHPAIWYFSLQSASLWMNYAKLSFRGLEKRCVGEMRWNAPPPWMGNRFCVNNIVHLARLWCFTPFRGHSAQASMCIMPMQWYTVGRHWLSSYTMSRLMWHIVLKATFASYDHQTDGVIAFHKTHQCCSLCSNFF